jgi:glutathione peroxidase
MKFGKKQNAVQVLKNDKSVQPVLSFYDLNANSISGEPFSFSKLKGKKVLIVNVASHCGYTNQYTELEQLFQQNKNELVILGFPANDFKNQEPGSDAEIASFCSLNFGVNFPLFKKQSVLNLNENQVYKWLTEPTKNGWNNQRPTWNFCKYLINEEGKLEGFFSAQVSPLSDELKSMINHS